MAYTSSIIGNYLPGVAQPAPISSAAPSTDWISKIIPGYGDLSSGAGGVIGNLLKGLPNPAIAKNAAATFGVANGMGNGSGFANRYGYDLYGQQAEKRQQSGIQDLLALISGLTSPALANQAQQNQVGEFNSNQQMNWQQMLEQLSAKNPANQPTQAESMGLQNNASYFTPAGSNTYVRT